MNNALTVCPTVFPIFASEPQTVELGYVFRLSSPDSYDYVDPQPFNTNRPRVFDFQTVTLNVQTAQLDFVSLLCSGCAPYTYPRKYLDRNANVMDNVTVRFEGRVSYTCQGLGYARSIIKFYESNAEVNPFRPASPLP